MSVVQVEQGGVQLSGDSSSERKWDVSNCLQFVHIWTLSYEILRALSPECSLFCPIDFKAEKEARCCGPFVLAYFEWPCSGSKSSGSKGYKIVANEIKPGW